MKKDISSTSTKLLIATALTGFIAGNAFASTLSLDGGVGVQQAEGDTGDKGGCSGKSGCKSEQSCKSKDSCKGQSGCKATDGDHKKE